jgi:predicted negative regulator of RcsB-dependent stress response
MPAAKTNWKRSAITAAVTVGTALVIGLGSTAWQLHQQVQSLEAQLLVSNSVNEHQQKEIDRLWDNLTDLWKNSSRAVAESAD